MSSRLLTDCVPKLAEAGKLICDDYNLQFAPDGLTCKPICTLRSTAEQLALFKKGRVVRMVDGLPVVDSENPEFIVTKLDGITKTSMHNPISTEPLSRAIDFGIFRDGKYITDDKYYEPLLGLANKYNLISGWDFGNTGDSIAKLKKNKKFKDPPHVQIKGQL